jgi:hypothetical protein
MATAMEVEAVTVSDIRTARAHVTGMPELCTSKGRNPIVPSWIEAVYNITSGRIYGVTVGGLRVSSGRTCLRRIDVDNLEATPEWVREFVEVQRP